MPTSAEQYLAEVTAKNRQQEQQRRIDKAKEAQAAGLVVPDLNPADRAVARMQQHAESIRTYQSLPPPSNNDDLRDRVARLENLLQLTLDSLNAATIECSGGSVVLTLPDLPT